MSSDRVFDLLVVQSWQVAVVGLIVWIIVAGVASDRPHLAHALWALVLLKCVTPPVWSSPTSPFSWSHASDVETVEIETKPSSEAIVDPVIARVPAARQRTENLIPVASSRPPPAATPHWRFPSARTSQAGIWVLGVFACLMITIIRFATLLRLVRCQSIATPEGLITHVRSLARTLGMSDRVRVRVLDAQIGPAVTGYWRPTILLPQSIVSGKNVSELVPLLAHELIHIRRGDLYWAALQTIAKACLWFHPVVWLASRQVDRESERCCDEETIASLGCAPYAYARMLMDVLEAKHRLREIPALPGVRPVDVTAKRLERIMRFGNGDRNGIHSRRPWWTTTILLLGAIVILPGAARVIGQDRSLPATQFGSDSGLKIMADEDHPFSKEVNHARQITIETELVQIPTRLLDNWKLSWEGEPDSYAHCVLDEDATKKFLTSLARNKSVVQGSAPKLIVLDGSDWQVQQSDQRTFVTGWEPFPGQEDQPVTTLSPVTEEVSTGVRVHGNATCLEACSDIQFSVQMERSSIASVETSMFHFENDIGGEPHPIQTPKIETREHAAVARLPLQASLVMRQPALKGMTTITVYVYRRLYETPEGAVKVANFLTPQSSASSDEVMLAETIRAKTERARIAKVYVDSGVDFTPEQIELIASRHDRLGLDSVQIKDGRLRVLPQNLAHVATARAMVEAERPENRPLLRGGETDEAFDYAMLTTALESCDIPCRIEGQVDYTINRDHIELRAAPIEISYTDAEQSFRFRADSGEIRVKLNASGEGLLFKFSGNVIIELGDWKTTADAIEMDETGCTLRGNITTIGEDDQKPLTFTADKLWIDPEWDSIDEIMKHAREAAHLAPR